MDSETSDWQVIEWTTALPHSFDRNHDSRNDPIARLYLCSTRVLNRILANLRQANDLPKALYRKLERCYSSLILWSHSYGVGEGKLDATLTNSQDLRHITIGLLVKFSAIILGRLVQHTAYDSDLKTALELLHAAQSEGWSVVLADSNDLEEMVKDLHIYQQEDDDLDLIASNMRSISQALIDLGPVMEDPIPDEEHEESCATMDRLMTAPNLVTLISYIFPKCDSVTAQGIAQALHQNWELLQESRSADIDKAGLPERDMTLVESLFRDSGLGTSAASQSLYAETIREYLGDSNQNFSIQLPKLPDAGRQGHAFACQSCQRTISVQTESEWKRHLMEDAKPYMCLEPTCKMKFSPFRTKDLWIAHVREHCQKAEELICPICQTWSQNTPRSMTRITKHLAYHLEAIAAEALIPGVSFNVVQEDVSANSREPSYEPPASSSSSNPPFSEDKDSHWDVQIAHRTSERQTDRVGDRPNLLERGRDADREQSKNIIRLHRNTEENQEAEKGPLLCPYCDRVFLRVRDRNKHVNMHTKPFKCKADKTCTTMTATPRDMNRHYEVWHKDYAFEIGLTSVGNVCAYCGVSFTRRDNYLRHLRTKHESR